METLNIINILGTEYVVVRQKEEENLKLKEAIGLCEVYSKKIVLREIEENENSYEHLEEWKKKIFRHEIIHAFFAESGLRNESDYAENEELVDWIAIQFHKIEKVFNELGI